MAITKFTSGINTNFSTELNANYASLYTSIGLNLIRMLQDRDIDFAVGQTDMWGDAYIDSTGREDSVNTSTTTATFQPDDGLGVESDDAYFGAFTDLRSGTTHESSTSGGGTWTSASNAFDSDNGTYATSSTIGSAGNNIALGKTFSSQYVDKVYVKYQLGGAGASHILKIQTYNGSSWDDVSNLSYTLASQSSVAVDIADTVEGVRIYTENTDSNNYTIQVYSFIPGSFAEGEITMDIPNGTFPTTVSSSIGIPFLNTWETGADVTYKLTNNFGANYVVIEATSIPKIEDFAINDCIIKEIESGKWILMCTSGTDEVRRAQIYKTLFYGTDGTNPRASSTYITGITALKTSHAADVGKRAYYYYWASSNTNGTESVTNTFNDTSTNTSCSAWSRCASVSSNSDGVFQFPTGTEVNRSDGASAVSDEFGTDTSADENNNPASIKLEKEYTSGVNPTNNVKALVICTGSMTSGTPTAGSQTTTDFFTDNSIPLFTAADTYTEQDTGWLSAGNSPEVSEFTTFDISPDLLTVKLTPKTTNPTPGYPSIKGFAVRAE
jgi:hypothetical protein